MGSYGRVKNGQRDDVRWTRAACLADKIMMQNGQDSHPKRTEFAWIYGQDSHGNGQFSAIL